MGSLDWGENLDIWGGIVRHLALESVWPQGVPKTHSGTREAGTVFVKCEEVICLFSHVGVCASGGKAT
jgi:hypothetical protein